MNRDPQAAAHHVVHEIEMFRRAWKERGDPLAYTAWFVHCRNLMTFFDNSGKGDEIKIRHFLLGVEREWKRGRRALGCPPNYSDYRKAATLLADHLTWQRTEARWQKYPPSRAITEYLLALCKLLARVLPEGRLAWFGGALQNPLTISATSAPISSARSSAKRRGVGS